MKKQEYAIVDIETTGGNADGSRMTEIAIVIHDGTQVIERWETLLNPRKEIPLPIFALTGINNEMVRDAPIFNEISEKVMQMLTGRIFVAHNVNFDYSFVRHELEGAGYKWSAKKLCTVRAARKIRPGLSSYSLGNLCYSLGIPIENRHRAGGDADATAVLFTKLLEWDKEGEIEKMVKKNAQDQRLPPNLPPEDFEKLPEKPGVYYFYDREHTVIYVGKAINLKKRVASHFTGHKTTPQRQHFLRDIFSISFEVCATELMALLLEYAEIKKLWPKYNSALKRFEPKFALYHYTAQNGYKYLILGKINKHQTCIEVFHTIQEGINTVNTMTEKFSIDQRFCKFCFSKKEDREKPTDYTNLPEAADHNSKIEQAIDHMLADKPTFFITDRGRTREERSCIWIEKGHFYGMGYISYDTGFTDPQQIKDQMVRYPSNQYSMKLITLHASKKSSKIVQLKT